MPNSNVLYEFGLATESLGHEQIICVLNDEYGSPHEDAGNVPFDIRHLRFPIGYRYGEASDRKKVEKQFVKKLVDALKTVSIYVLQHRKHKFLPLQTWEGWLAARNEKQKYISNEKINKIASNIRHAVTSHKTSVRILGLSGLGKTTILFELFRPKEEDQLLSAESKRCYYPGTRGNILGAGLYIYS